MKVKSGFIVFFIICALLFSSCDFFDDLFNGGNNNGDDENDIKTSVEPLLQTKWSQNSPYNAKLRELAQSGVGDISDLTTGICGIVGWAQIMKYHKHPARGIGQNEAWTHTNSGKNLPLVNFEVNYDWDNMLNSYRSNGTDSSELQRNAVAELYYIISIGRVDGDVQKTVNNFGYDGSLRRLQRLYYDDAAWERILREQLDAGLPVGYQGRGNANHFFVIDGYDKEGRFHVNWGWGGSHDGYYFINNLNPGTYLFNDHNRHSMFINFMPDNGGKPDYEFALRNFSVNKTSVSQNESFTVSWYMINLGNLDFPGGRWGVALVDDNDNITIISDAATSSLQALWSRELSRNCSVPGTVNAGQYRLRIAVRPSDGDWKIITLSAVHNDVPNAIPFTVK